MSFMYFGKMKNQVKAARAAQRLVGPLAISDIECMIADSVAFDQDALEDLYVAVDSEYAEIDQRFCELAKIIENNLPNEAQNAFVDYQNAGVQLEGLKNTAWFNVGFQAALRLLGAPDMRMVRKQLKAVAS